MYIIVTHGDNNEADDDEYNSHAGFTERTCMSDVTWDRPVYPGFSESIALLLTANFFHHMSNY